MNKRRVISFVIISLLLVMFISSVVSATIGEDIRGFASEASSTTRSVFDSIGLGGVKSTTWLFSALLGMIIYLILDSVSLFKGKNPYLVGGISFVVTVLAIIGIPQDLLASMAASYGAMGAAILLVIPFLIVAAFTMKVDNLLIAKLTWIAFATYYLILYFGQMISSETFFTGFWNFTGGVLGILAFFFIKGARGKLFEGELEAMMESEEQKIAKRQAGLNLEGKRTEISVSTSS